MTWVSKTRTSVNVCSVDESCPYRVLCVLAAMGMMIGRTMTIYKDGDDLIILNSIRVNEAVEKDILELGQVKHLVRMCDAHGLDDPYYFDKFKPTYWGLDTFKAINGPNGPLRHTKVLQEGDTPIPNMKVVTIQSGKECTFWIPDHGGTVIACDLVQNVTEIPIHASWFGGKITKWGGFMGECTCAPPLWKILHGKDHKQAVQNILSWDFENLFTAHGSARVGGAKPLCVKHFAASLGDLMV